MKKSRLLVSDVAEITGLHPATVRNLANRGFIKSKRDWNNWRTFTQEEVEKLKIMAGTNEKPAESERVGTTNA